MNKNDIIHKESLKIYNRKLKIKLKLMGIIKDNNDNDIDQLSYTIFYQNNQKELTIDKINVENLRNFFLHLYNNLKSNSSFINININYCNKSNNKYIINEITSYYNINISYNINFLKQLSYAREILLAYCLLDHERLLKAIVFNDNSEYSLMKNIVNIINDRENSNYLYLISKKKKIDTTNNKVNIYSYYDHCLYPISILNRSYSLYHLIENIYFSNSYSNNGVESIIQINTNSRYLENFDLNNPKEALSFLNKYPYIIDYLLDLQIIKYQKHNIRLEDKIYDEVALKYRKTSLKHPKTLTNK